MSAIILLFILPFAIHFAVSLMTQFNNNLTNAGCLWLVIGYCS